jgi:PAS domain-containing protein
MSPEVAIQRLARAEKRVELLERLLEDKSRELYESAEALARSHAQLEQIFCTIPLAIFACDPSLAVVRMNDAAIALVGVPPGACGRPRDERPLRL